MRKIAPTGIAPLEAQDERALYLPSRKHHYGDFMS
jgi:hypothetical protein